jgi:hypothetical protein
MPPKEKLPPVNGEVKTKPGESLEELTPRAPVALAGQAGLESTPPPGAPPPASAPSETPEAEKPPELTAEHLRTLAAYRPGKATMDVKGIAAQVEELVCVLCGQVLFHAHGIGLQLTWNIAGPDADVIFKHCGVELSLKTLQEAKQRHAEVTAHLLAKNANKPR